MKAPGSPRAATIRSLNWYSANSAAVLELVTTKKPQLESRDLLKRRIDEATKYVPLDRLALSPRCGFASVLAGNKVTYEDPRRKLELVVQAATEIWGTRR